LQLKYERIANIIEEFPPPSFGLESNRARVLDFGRDLFAGEKSASHEKAKNSIAR
jgi:hypothetical protein